MISAFWVGCLAAISVLGLGWALKFALFDRPRRAGARQAMDILTDAGSHLSKEIGDLQASIERERQRADSYLSKIKEIEGERDARMSLYYQQASEHGNAQDLLMREIESLAAQYRRVQTAVATATTLEDAKAAAAASLRLTRGLDVIVAEFAGRHVPAAPQANPIA